MIDFDSLQRLDGPTLLRLANSLESGLISPPFSHLSLQGYIGSSDVVPAASFLERLSDSTSSPAQMALVLRAFVAGRPHTVSPSGMIDVVVSGPDSARTSRDTGVVMRQLFGQAQERVLAVGFAVHQGRSVFRALADRMDAQQDLQVTLCLDVRRDPTSTSIDNQIKNRFARTFVDQEWPGSRLPGVYFDPRSLASGTGYRSALHSKCVVVDGKEALVTSANFTEAAQERNIELGLLVKAPEVARQIEEHFHSLIRDGHLERLPFPSPGEATNSH